MIYTRLKFLVLSLLIPLNITSLSYADFYVIPVHPNLKPTCNGTINGTRWCDNGNGTVTDLTTGMVWLKDAFWGGLIPFWANTVNGVNAHYRAAQVEDGITISISGVTTTLSDGSVII